MTQLKDVNLMELQQLKTIFKYYHVFGSDDSDPRLQSRHLVVPVMYLMTLVDRSFAPC